MAINNRKENYIMDGVKFIKTGLERECSGKITVYYRRSSRHLFVQIGSDPLFRYHRKISPCFMSDTAILTTIVKIIVMLYKAYLLDIYFKNFRLTY